MLLNKMVVIQSLLDRPQRCLGSVSQSYLAQYGFDMCLDRSLGDRTRPGYGFVGFTTSDAEENLLLPVGEVRGETDGEGPANGRRHGSVLPLRLRCRDRHAIKRDNRLTLLPTGFAPCSYTE